MTILNALKTIKWGDVASRAGWTALQAFLAVALLASESFIDLLFKGDWTGLYGVAISIVAGGLAAGLSAVKTVLISVIADLKDKSK